MKTSYTLIKNEKYGYTEVFPKPSKEQLNHFYENKYYQELKSSSYATIYTNDELEWFNGSSIITDYIWKNFSNSSVGKLCDIGCGEGFFSSWFFKNKWTVRTVDYSDFGIKKQNPFLLETFCKDDVYNFIQRETNESYDLINLSNVLEHVLDPIKLLNDVKKLMGKKSLLRICVPNDYSPFQEFLLSNKMTSETWVVPPEHLTYFNIESLSKLVLDLGFTIETAMASFPIEFYLANGSSNYWIDRSLGKQAHIARVKIDNFLLKQGFERYLNYYKSAADIGVGRDITIFLSYKG